MSWRRASTVLAMLAALVMAPSSVSAAKPNELLSASVVPMSGTVSTPFELSVRYVSEAGNPATAVTATVAGQTILMANTSGTALDGTWMAVTQLPAGSWTVTYTAVVAKGPVPTVRSGTISVAGTEPTSSSPGSSPSNVASGSGGGTQSSAPNPVESAGASVREPAPSRGAQPSAPTSNTSPGAEPMSSPSAVANPSADNGGVEPLATPDGAAAPAGRGAVPSGSGGGATAGSVDPANPDLLNMVLLLGIVGVAAVALVGVGWIAITGRRNDPEASLADAGIGADPAIRAIPTVEQRAIRRARLNQSNDPILAALGLPDNDPPPPAADELEGRRPRGKKRAER